MTQTSVDFSPLLVALIQAGAAGITLLGVPVLWAIWNLINRKLHLTDQQVSAAKKAEIDALLQKSIGFAVARSTEAATDYLAKADTNVNVKNALIADAMNYAVMRGPELLKQAGIDPATDLSNMIESRLGLKAITQTTSPVSASDAMGTGNAAPIKNG